MNIMETIKNFKPKDLLNPKVLKTAAAVGAALVAYNSARLDQKKEDAFNNLVNRVNKLEGK